MYLIKQFFTESNENGIIYYVRKCDGKKFYKHIVDSLTEEDLRKVGSAENTPELLID